jgi:ribonuclease P/MRP protein subunit RPP1
MRRKVDILLDGLDRRLDYATVMLAAEKDVAIELGLSKFLKKYGIRRMRLFEELYDEIRVINKFDTPFIITSAAESIYDMRTRIQIENFFSFFGADILKARFYAERLIRRYYDPKYVMDGFEVE